MCAWTRWASHSRTTTQSASSARATAAPKSTHRVHCRTALRFAAQETELGYVPAQLDMTGLESMGAERFAQATAVKKDEWRKEMPLHAEMVEGKLAEKAPPEMLQRYEALKASFA